MTKNQVNYLLALATLVVVWLYLNTFFMAALVQKKSAAMYGRSPVASLTGGEEAYFPRSSGSREYRSGRPSLEEIKKMIEARKAAAQATMKAPGVPVPVPAPVVPEKK